DGLGAEKASEVSQALLQRAPVTLRVDPTRADRGALIEKLRAAGSSAHATAVAPLGITLDVPRDLRGWPELEDARLEVQDEGSQLLGLAVGARPGDVVLDACAGAGGKTLHLWSQMEGRGELVAVEPDAKKREVLKKRLQGAGASGVQVVAGHLEEVSGEWRDRFDRILIDAPCTGTGTLRRHPDLKWRIQESSLAHEVGRQTRLLGAGVPLLKPAGRMVYGTCSVLVEENEAVIETFARAAEGLDPSPLERGWGADVDRGLEARGRATARIGPGADGQGPDGFFVAAFEKRGE
ncbi:MAG: RsmB/NOP family class I SAM-dependent RNA methyltransferase, partial [Myxococcota bacterium]